MDSARETVSDVVCLDESVSQPPNGGAHGGEMGLPSPPAPHQLQKVGKNGRH